MRNRLLLVTLLVVTALLATGGTAQAAIPGAAAGHATPPWVLVGGLATVPIALISLIALLHDRPLDRGDQDEIGGRLSAQGAACSNCDASRIRTSSRP